MLDDVNITFRPGENMGILGLNGAGKSTLMRIIGGAELPDSGKVVRKSRVSWPIGFAGGFHGSLTGRENLRFTSRIYGSDIRKVTEFVEDFSELGPYMDMPVRTYSSGMKSKLAFLSHRRSLFRGRRGLSSQRRARFSGTQSQFNTHRRFT